MKRKSNNIRIIGFCLLSAFFLPGFKWAFAAPEKGNYQLLLAGGALKTCSSMAMHHCADEDQAKRTFAQARQKTLYEINALTLQRVKTSLEKTGFSTEEKKSLMAFLSKLSETSNGRFTIEKLTELAGKFELTSQETKIVGDEFLKTLPAPLYHFILDSLEATQFDEQGARLKESVDLYNNKNPFAVAIYQKFYELAKAINGKSKPKIIVLTASARDSFEVADFYESVFNHFFADVIWLPLEPALLQAINKGQCDLLARQRSQLNSSYARDRIYPQRIKLQLEYCHEPQRLNDVFSDADGVFINGGDQSLTLASLKNADGSDSPWMKMIRERFNNQQIIIGGTSAGTAVQSGGQHRDTVIPMISNGSSYESLKNGAFATEPPQPGCGKNCAYGLNEDSLTYKASGGLGLFGWGIFDTHFSERGRQARLMALAKATGSRWSFGVDETTALMIRSTVNGFVAETVGENGVWVFKTSGSDISDDHNNAPPEYSALASYLSFGDQLVVEDETMSIDFASGKTSDTRTTRALTHKDILHRDHFRTLALNLAFSNRAEATGKSYERDPAFEVHLGKNKHWQFAWGSYQFGEYTRLMPSFANLAITIKRIQ